MQIAMQLCSYVHVGGYHHMRLAGGFNTMPRLEIPILRGQNDVLDYLSLPKILPKGASVGVPTDRCPNLWITDRLVHHCFGITRYPRDATSLHPWTLEGLASFRITYYHFHNVNSLLSTSRPIMTSRLRIQKEAVSGKAPR